MSMKVYQLPSLLGAASQRPPRIRTLRPAVALARSDSWSLRSNLSATSAVSRAAHGALQQLRGFQSCGREPVPVPRSFSVRCSKMDPIDTQGDAPGKAGKDRPSFAEESRTLVQLARSCFIATLSEFDGYPFGSMVDIACDDQGRPIFLISTLSTHTRDLMEDPRMSVTVQQQNFSGIQDARVTLVGECYKVDDGEVAEVKENFLKVHHDAFWAEFADFSLWRMDKILRAQYVGGFGRAGKISETAYFAAAPDPVAAFTPQIAGHMNADHKGSIIAMLAHYGGLKVDDAQIVSLDKCGIDIQVTEGENSWKQRLPFIRQVEGRKDVKDVLVEMTKTAAAAAKCEEAA